MDNGDGQITLTEFIEGSTRLRGSAKALDVWRLETKAWPIVMSWPGEGFFANKATEKGNTCFGTCFGFCRIIVQRFPLLSTGILFSSKKIFVYDILLVAIVCYSNLSH